VSGPSLLAPQLLHVSLHAAQTKPGYLSLYLPLFITFASVSSQRVFFFLFLFFFLTMLLKNSFFFQINF
jgi:hypothetical protein